MADAEGIGEQLDQVIPPFTTEKGPGLVLINTGIAVPTGAVFAARAESGIPFADAADYPPGLDQKGWEQLCHLGNSLAEAARVVCPEIDEAAVMIAGLSSASGARHWGMSGSGATFLLSLIRLMLHIMPSNKTNRLLALGRRAFSRRNR